VVNEETLFPCVIYSPGRIIDVCMMNEKGFIKSLENDRIWTVHRETGRLLPYEREFSSLRIVKKRFWIEAEVSENEQEREIAEDHKITIPEKEQSVLHYLTEIVHQRREELPEGSYTTHLFTSGDEKIRKKLGEEVIELVLAREKKEMLWESADLLYHLIVLLETQGLTIFDVLQELAGREKKS